MAALRNPLGCDCCYRGRDILTQALRRVKTCRTAIAFSKQTRDQRMSSAGEEDVFSLYAPRSLWAWIVTPLLFKQSIYKESLDKHQLNSD